MARSSISVQAEEIQRKDGILPSADKIGRGSLDGLQLPLHILHVQDCLMTGGTEKVLMKLIQGLDPELFEHHVCYLRGGATAPEAWTSFVHVLNAGRERAPLHTFQFNFFRLMRVMRTVRPTIVHSRNWGAIEAALAARFAGVPVTIHSEHGYELEMISGLPLRRRLLRNVVYRTASAIAAVTNDLRQYHAQQAWYSPEAFQVLYNGVDGRTFRPQPDVRDATRRQYGIPREALVVGSVGRMTLLKDFSTLLKAVEAVMAVSSNLYVLLVGKGAEMAHLKKYVADSTQLADRVVFPGQVESVAGLLNAMDIFVLPTLMEGMSNTLLEAMAVGLPVVATRVGGNPEVVVEQHCGYLFTPKDVPALTRHLRTLARDPGLRAEFGRAARDRVLQHFSIEQMLKRYHDLYVNLALSRSEVQASSGYVRN